MNIEMLGLVQALIVTFLRYLVPPPPPPIVDLVDSPSTTDSDGSDISDYDYEDYADVWYDGQPGAYFGGYGRCYNCGRAGHWANGCPYR